MTNPKPESNDDRETATSIDDTDFWTSVDDYRSVADRELRSARQRATQRARRYYHYLGGR